MPFIHKGIAAFLAAVVLCPRPAAAAEDVQALLAQAAVHISSFNFSDGYRLARQARERATEGSPAWEQAVFTTAVCAQQLTPTERKRVDESAELYRLLIGKSPDSRFRPRAMMNLARLLELRDYPGDVVNVPAARELYQQVIARSLAEPIAGEATLRLASSFIQTYDQKDVRSGIALLESWLRGHPDDPLASAMWQYMGDANFYPLNDFAAALECYEQADRLGWTDPARQGPTYWRMGLLAERHLNDPKRAATYYTKIITKTPNSGKAYPAQEALRRLGYTPPEISTFTAAEE